MKGSKSVMNRGGPNAFCNPNLIDGCDYCGTKFKVEDLGKRVSEFALRKDYRVEYNKYKQMRKKAALWVGLAVTAVSLVISAIFTAAAMIEAIGDSGFFTGLVAGVMTLIIGAGFIGCIGAAFFAFYIFPWIQLGAGVNHLSKKTLDRLRKASFNDKKMQEKVREFDANFSVSDFYSGVQNKLATMFYASDKNQINAFASGDFSKYLGEFTHIADVDTENIALSSYKLENGLQKAGVKADVKLVFLNGNRAKSARRRVRLTMIKSADCKTQQVCEPSVLRCKNCGSSISLLDGAACKYCGTELDLKQFDWVIDGFSIK